MDQFSIPRAISWSILFAARDLTVDARSPYLYFFITQCVTTWYNVNNAFSFYMILALLYVAVNPSKIDKRGDFANIT